jgi:hypothetical protein
MQRGKRKLQLLPLFWSSFCPAFAILLLCSVPVKAGAFAYALCRYCSRRPPYYV